MPWKLGAASSAFLGTAWLEFPKPRSEMGLSLCANAATPGYPASQWQNREKRVNWHHRAGACRPIKTTRRTTRT